MSSMTDIASLIESLSPDEIKTIMDEVKQRKPTRVSTERKARRMAITQLYFDNAPTPKDDWQDYLNHSDGIRDQCVSGVDL